MSSGQPKLCCSRCRSGSTVSRMAAWHVFIAPPLLANIFALYRHQHLWQPSVEEIKKLLETELSPIRANLQSIKKKFFDLKTSVDYMSATGTADGEGLVGPRPHHFFAPPPPLLALKRKIIIVQVFFRLYSAIFSVFSLISNARHFVGLLCFSR